MSARSVSLPPTRSLIEIGTVASVVAGVGFPLRLQGRSVGTFPFFKVGDISRAWQLKQTRLAAAEHYLEASDLKEIGAKPIASGAVVFAKIGAAVALNRRAILSRPSLIDNNCFAVVPDLRYLTPGFAFHFLCSVDLGRLTRATTVPSLRKGDVESLTLPVWSLSYQARVVAEIEKQFTRLGEAAATLELLQAKLKRARASVLKAAVDGRLVPTEAELARAESRSYEPASILLDRISDERRRRWPSGRKYESPQEAETAELPELPEGWVWTTVDAVQVHLTSGSRDWTIYQGRGTGVFLLAQNVRPGLLDLSVQQTVDPPTNDPARERSHVRKDDLLVTIVGANTGQVCRVPSELPEHFVCQSVALIRPAVPGCSRFLDLFLNSPLAQRIWRGLIYGQGRPHLGFSDLRRTPTPLPPLAEQVRIAAEVERRLSVLDALEHTVEQSLARCGRLRQAILKRAFEGRLVRQDPADEPASKLLARIRGQRATEATA